jgi:putative sigma-54 modulation protein
MTVETKGIHVEVTQRIQDYIDAKMPRLEYAKDLIVTFLLNLSREKNLYKVEATINFRWGAVKHVGVENYDLTQGIDALFDTLDAVVEKEKSKVKDHHAKHKDVAAEEES